MKSKNIIFKGLYAPFSYWKTSEIEKKKYVNGCGPKSLPHWLIPDQLLGTDVTESCNIHDWMIKESKTKDDFKIADELFLKNMKLELPQKRGIITILRNALTYLYFGAVRVYSTFTNWNRKES